jgi:hypothetical protein
VRIGAVAGCLLLALSLTGWWMATRVLDDEGFGDVVAISSQREPVRAYIADQATLRLARSSNFVSAARPIVTEAISAAIATPPVEHAVHDAAARAHAQVFQARGQRRVDVDAAQASVSVRGALQAINPSLAKKLPANVLDASTTVSQSSEVDLLFRITTWVDWLWIPIGVLGAVVLGLVLFRARDRVHAIRVVGVTMAVVGALLVGFGAATPVFAVAAATNDPLRGAAVAEFIEVLLGRLVGGGLALILGGLLLAFAPGRDGGDLAGRAHRAREWWRIRSGSRRWRLAFAAAVAALATYLLTDTDGAVTVLVSLAGVALLYVAVVVALRAAGLLVADAPAPPFRKRQIAGVAAAMVGALVITASSATAVVAATTKTPEADTGVAGCNGYIELCAQPLDQIVWPASHNAMNSAAYDFFAAEHTITIPEQLNAGIRFFMLDAYYGYDQSGIVRTNLAGGVDRADLRREKGEEAVRELDRLGALTGTADTSGARQDVYLCHDFCELGAVKAVDILRDVRAFLDQHLTEVVMLDFEDYVRPADLRRVLDEAGLSDRIWKPKPSEVVDGVPRLPVLGDMVTPARGEAERKQRLIVMTEKHPQAYSWQLPTYRVSEETPYDWAKISDFTCKPNRGKTSKQLLIVNHWLRANGPPDPVGAADVNSKATLTKRLQRCTQVRRRLPNVLAVDFTAVGDLSKTVDRFNGAVAELTGVAPLVKPLLDRERLTPAERREALGYHRLPTMSREQALELVGPAATALVVPAGVEETRRQLAADGFLKP